MLEQHLDQRQDIIVGGNQIVGGRQTEHLMGSRRTKPVDVARVAAQDLLVGLQADEHGRPDMIQDRVRVGAYHLESAQMQTTGHVAHRDSMNPSHC